MVKYPPANAADIRDTVPSLGQEDPLEKEMATYSSVLAWEIAEEAGRLQSTGLPKSWTCLSNYATAN